VNEIELRAQCLPRVTLIKPDMAYLTSLHAGLSDARRLSGTVEIPPLMRPVTRRNCITLARWFLHVVGPFVTARALPTPFECYRGHVAITGAHGEALLERLL
jgi:hypothetical protein